MIEQLREIHSLCLKHEDYDSAGRVGKLVELFATDSARFWELLTSNSIWGGPGSFADQCLMSSRTGSEAELKRDRRIVWHALSEIATEMESAGRLNDRTVSWASAFRAWLREGL